MQNDTPEHDVSLESLWKSQAEKNIDWQIIKRRAQAQKRKQRLYVAIDLISLSPFLLFYYVDFNFTKSLFLFVNILFVVSIVFVIYLIRLRWVSLFQMDLSTHDFSNKLLQQLRNNKKIAMVNKHIGWLSMLAVVFAHLNTGFMNEVEMSVAQHRAFISLAITSVLMVPWVWWFHKREKRFEQEANDLASQLQA